MSAPLVRFNRTKSGTHCSGLTSWTLTAGWFFPQSGHDCRSHSTARVAALAQTEKLVVIMDDGGLRDAVRAVRTDIAVIGTRTFIRWMEEDFGIKSAATA